jgi:hypothetical protein
MQTLTVYAADVGLLATQLGVAAWTVADGCRTLLIATMRMRSVPK